MIQSVRFMFWNLCWQLVSEPAYHVSYQNWYALFILFSFLESDFEFSYRCKFFFSCFILWKWQSVFWNCKMIRWSVFFSLKWMNIMYLYIYIYRYILRFDRFNFEHHKKKTICFWTRQFYLYMYIYNWNCCRLYNIYGVTNLEIFKFNVISYNVYRNLIF